MSFGRWSTDVSWNLRFTLLAPDLLRTDSQENIYLQADGLTSPITASIVIQDFAKTVSLLQDSVDLSLSNGYQALKTIQVGLTTASHQGGVGGLKKRLRPSIQ